MSFRLVPKSVTLNDLERRNGRYFALFQRILVASGRKSLRSLSHLLMSSCCTYADALSSLNSVSCHVTYQVSTTSRF